MERLRINVNKAIFHKHKILLYQNEIISKNGYINAINYYLPDLHIYEKIQYLFSHEPQKDIVALLQSYHEKIESSEKELFINKLHGIYPSFTNKTISKINALFAQLNIDYHLEQARDSGHREGQSVFWRILPTKFDTDSSQL